MCRLNILALGGSCESPSGAVLIGVLSLLSASSYQVVVVALTALSSISCTACGGSTRMASRKSSSD